MKKEVKSGTKAYRWRTKWENERLKWAQVTMNFVNRYRALCLFSLFFYYHHHHHLAAQVHDISTHVYVSTCDVYMRCNWYKKNVNVLSRSWHVWAEKKYQQKISATASNSSKQWKSRLIHLFMPVNFVVIRSLSHSFVHSHCHVTTKAFFGVLQLLNSSAMLRMGPSESGSAGANGWDIKQVSFPKENRKNYAAWRNTI